MFLTGPPLPHIILTVMLDLPAKALRYPVGPLAFIEQKLLIVPTPDAMG
jgi:hypothetical protein